MTTETTANLIKRIMDDEHYTNPFGNVANEDQICKCCGEVTTHTQQTFLQWGHEICPPCDAFHAEAAMIQELNAAVFE